MPPNPLPFFLLSDDTRDYPIPLFDFLLVRPAPSSYEDATDSDSDIENDHTKSNPTKNLFILFEL
jgi:hypothetical protein